MELITSKDNKRIKYISKLISSAAFRRAEGAFVAEGLRLCDDAFSSGMNVQTAVFSESFLAKHGEFAERAASAAGAVFSVPDRIFCALSDTKTPQGVLFVIKALDISVDFDTIKQNGNILALESMQDPANLGTVFRCAEALGIRLIVMNDTCCDVYSPKVLRGSMGAVFRQPFLIAGDLCGFIRSFNEQGTSYAAVLDNEAIPLNKCAFKGSSLCVIGNEGNGISAEVIDACTHKLYIPMQGGAESLNAASAASIIIWEMIK